MIPAVLALCIFLLLIAFIGVHLRAAGYAPALSAILLFILVLQLLTALTATVFSAGMLALVMSFVAASAAALARVQTARRVVTLGFSLAATQVVSPMGVIVTAILAPALTFLWPPNETRARNTGLLTLLLFVPVAAALMLAYLAREFRFDLAALMAGPFDRILPARIFDHASALANGLINAAVLAVMAFPIWLLAAFQRCVRIVAVVTSALILAVALTAFFHRSYSLGVFAPSIAGLSFLALSEAGSEAMLPEQALPLAALSTIAAWLFVAIPI